MSSDYTPQITDEMRTRYVERRKADFELVDTALAKLDFETLKSVAHQIKGNAATFSFDSLEAAAIRLEKAALSEDQAEARLAIDEFRSWLETQATPK